MKNFKKIIGKVVILLAACFMFASFSPSLDGRVVVVDQGEFPQGLFAKTVGYLPGDIISVANITGDNTVDLLVIGALDPSEGVAIMITPEAAQAIGIEKDSNNIVKITKRSGQDERVYGTAVIAKQNLAQLNNESTYDETDEYGFEDETSEINETEFEQSTNDENEPFTETEEEALSEETEEFEETLDTDEESETETEDSFEETLNENEEEYFEEELTEEEFEEEFSEENEESALEDSIEQEPFEEETEEQIEELVQTPLEAEELDETQEPYSEEQIEGIEENNETENTEISEEIPSEEFYEEEIYEDLVLEPLEEFSPTLLEEKKDEEIESEQTEPLTEETSDAEIEDVELTEESVELEDETETEAESENTESEEFVEIEETKEEEYEAIVLIPTNSMPPVQNEEEKTEEPSQTETSEEKTESFDELPAETPAEPDTDTEEKPEITEKPEVEQLTEVLSYEKYMVGSLKDLESGKYYIQIATLSIDANIMEIVNKYSKNYPITIVPMAGGIRKQIMVGPLSVDEYAVVLERFRSYGYKDAFLRKIK
ncbi:MAG: hypothetical protein MR739_02280 [Spirochaetia bacterium]|nr:hypothetical protein [Spirochaetia bacterium]